MTELRVFDANGIELGYVSSKHSRWFMDADGVLFNDEDIHIPVAIEGMPQYIDLYGKVVRRSRGNLNMGQRWACPGDTMVVPRGALRLNVFPKKE